MDKNDLGKSVPKAFQHFLCGHTLITCSLAPLVLSKPPRVNKPMALLIIHDHSCVPFIHIPFTDIQTEAQPLILVAPGRLQLSNKISPLYPFPIQSYANTCEFH